MRPDAVVALLLALSPAVLHAQESQSGARARALGGAATAFSDDPHGVWSNPAGTAVQPGGIAVSFETYPLYEERGVPATRAPARPSLNDPVFLPSFLGVVYQIGTPEQPQALGLGLATPFHLYFPFRGPDPAPGSDPTVTVDQQFTRLRLSYAIDLPSLRLSIGLGLDLATARFEYTSPPDNDRSPVDHGVAPSGGLGLHFRLFDNGEDLRATVGLAYQGPAAFEFGSNLSAPSGIVPFFDWPQQIQAGIAVYLLARLPLRFCLEAQWTDWEGAAQGSQLAGVESFSSSLAFSVGAEVRVELSSSIALLPRLGLKVADSPWRHRAKADLPGWGRYQLFLDARSTTPVVACFGVGLTWGYAEGTQDTLDLALTTGGDAPGIAISYTFQF